MALPKAKRTNKRITKRRGQTTIITESPHRNELVALEKATELKEQ